MSKIVVGNIKMNMKFNEISNYLNHFKDISSKNLIICPSYIYIPYFLKYNFYVGSQNVCKSEEGRYTGEVSAKQLSSIGVKYTIVGHSERRIKMHETSEEINKKIISALDANLKVILCIGETEEEKNTNQKQKVLFEQIKESLYGIGDLKNVIIAYEPVWSVGTNKLPTRYELINSINYIKNIVYELTNQNIKVLYGGSVNNKNVDELNTIEELDGYLIGSASINPIQFIDIIKKVL